MKTILKNTVMLTRSKYNPQKQTGDFSGEEVPALAINPSHVIAVEFNEFDGAFIYLTGGRSYQIDIDHDLYDELFTIKQSDSYQAGE